MSFDDFDRRFEEHMDKWLFPVVAIVGLLLAAGATGAAVYVVLRIIKSLWAI